MLGKKFVFEILNQGGINAGLCSFTDTIIVFVGSGNPGGNPGQFEEYMKNCLSDWFNGANVVLK